MLEKASTSRATGSQIWAPAPLQLKILPLFFSKDPTQHLLPSGLFSLCSSRGLNLDQLGVSFQARSSPNLSTPTSTSQLRGGLLKRNFMPNACLGRRSKFSSRVSRYLDELRVCTPLKKSGGGKEWAWGSLEACCPGMLHPPKQQLLPSSAGLVLAKKQLEPVILSMLDFWERKDIFKILCLGSSQGHRQAYHSHYPWLILPPTPVSAI